MYFLYIFYTLYSPNFTSTPLYNASQKVWEFIQEIPAVVFAVAPCPVCILNNAEYRYSITRIQSQNPLVLYLNCLTDWSYCKYLSSCFSFLLLEVFGIFLNDMCIDHQTVIGNALCTFACKVVIKNVRTVLDLLHRAIFNNSIVIFTSTLLPWGRLISVNTIVRLWQLAPSN